MMLERDRQYLEYVDRHRRFVLEEATKLDIRDRGLAHDLSKYSKEEFEAYAEYFYGGHPRGNAPEYVQLAFDRAWLLHQKRNDHHWQYLVLREDSGAVKALPMPEEAMREMLADWRGAGRAITGVDNTPDWYAKNKPNMILHPSVEAWLDRMLLEVRP
jgi:hypothetical protein